VIISAIATLFQISMLKYKTGGPCYSEINHKLWNCLKYQNEKQ